MGVESGSCVGSYGGSEVGGQYESSFAFEGDPFVAESLSCFLYFLDVVYE